MTTPTIERITPARTALLLMDYQHGILARLPDADALLTRAQETIELLRSRGVTIGYVRVGFAEGEKPGGRMGARITPEVLTALHADAPATQIHDRVAPRDGDIVVRKVRVGPFGTTDLHSQLQARGIDTLILAGLSTSGVVLSAVRDGHDRDYRLIVVSDLVADPEPDLHEFLIDRVIPRQADVVAAADLPGLLN
jgi:nicotinamidase-related amidase